MSEIGARDSSAGSRSAVGEYTIGLTPNRTADKTAVNLGINLQVVRPSGLPSAH